MIIQVSRQEFETNGGFDYAKGRKCESGVIYKKKHKKCVSNNNGLPRDRY